MFADLPILSFMTFLPLLGAFIIILTCSDNEQGAKNSKMVSLWTSVITFLVSVVLYFNFDNLITDFQFVEKVNWLPNSGISYFMGVDGISLPFVLLSTFLKSNNKCRSMSDKSCQLKLQIDPVSIISSTNSSISNSFATSLAIFSKIRLVLASRRPEDQKF